MRLNCDGPLSNVAFNFNLRRYSLVALVAAKLSGRPVLVEVGRCRLTLSKLELKARLVSALETEL